MREQIRLHFNFWDCKGSYRQNISKYIFSLTTHFFCTFSYRLVCEPDRIQSRNAPESRFKNNTYTIKERILQPVFYQRVKSLTLVQKFAVFRYQST